MWAAVSLTEHGAVARIELAMLGILIRKGPGVGGFFPLLAESSPYAIGRTPESTVFLDDPAVSRRHAEISFQQGKWVLRDLGSRNGTLLNSLPINQVNISVNDRITIGPVEFVVIHRGGGAPIADPVSLDDTIRTAPVDTDVAMGVIGSSPQIAAVIATAARVAPLDVPVLIRGETGTGKELISRALHGLSPRRKLAFVAVNCGSLAEGLVESVLFGHEKGSFTGADVGRPGRFEEADGGTIFLDEVGELPTSAQASLLRVLEEKVIRRLGGARDLRVDVRVIAATNRDMERALREGSFRSDLYHRLNVVEIVIPPLRERKEDIASIAEHFLPEVGMTVRGEPMRLTRGALEKMHAHDWPGNVRELRNILSRAAVRATGPEVRAEDIAFTDPGYSARETAVPVSDPDVIEGGSPQRLSDRMAHAEADIVRAALEAEGWNRSAAARRLGVSEGKIRKCIRDYGIEKD